MKNDNIKQKKYTHLKMKENFKTADLTFFTKNIEYYKNISYQEYIVLILSMLDLDPKWFVLSDMSNLCRKMTTLYNNNVQKELFFSKRIIHGNYFRMDYFIYLKNNITYNDFTLTILNSPHNIKGYKDFFKSNYLVFDEENNLKTKFIEQVNDIKKSFPYDNIEYTENLFEIKDDIKYDNIITKLSFFMTTHYIGTFSLLKFPLYFYVIISSLLRLKKNGHLFINIPHIYMNESYKKLIIFLSNKFQDMYVFNQKKQEYGIGSIIHCKSFKGNITDKEFSNLINLSNSIKNYTYSFCDYLNYNYYISKNKKETPIFYYIPSEDLPKGYKINIKELKVIKDIKLNYKENYLSSYIIYNLETYYNNFFELINKIIDFNISKENNFVVLDKDFIEKSIFQRTLDILTHLKENNLPVSNSYSGYINEYNKDILNSYFSLKESIKYNILDYSYNISKISKVNSYYYDNIKNIEENSEYYIETKNNLLKKFKNRSLPKEIKSFTEDFARGVSNFINNNCKLNYPISNAFTKLWEIIVSIPHIIKNKKELNSFHIAEAPGQWIKCISHYIIKYKKNIKNFNWKANTLNYENDYVNKNYEPLNDTYGFIKNNRKKWLYGEDDTGDITNFKNIKWFKDYYKNIDLDLVTGDAGTFSEDLELLQKLDFSQMCLVMAVSNKGSNCIIKHFLPYINQFKESKFSSGFFINYIYVYFLYFDKIWLVKPHTSSSNTGEFYLIGKNFKGIPDIELDKLINILKNFKTNNCFFNEKDIPEDFLNQVTNFIKDVIKININNFEAQNTLLTCKSEKKTYKDITGCDKFLDEEYIYKIQTKRFKEWIKINKFIR